MAGEVFKQGEVKTRPGTYVRTSSLDELIPELIRGIVAVIFRASWGPVVPTLLEAEAQVTDKYFSGGTTKVARQAFRGGARKVLALRAGTGGVAATLMLQDIGVPSDVVRIDAKHVGTKGNDFKVTRRVAPADAAKREFLVYDGTELRETITYTPGADEAQALTDAVNNASTGSAYVKATKLDVGVELASVTQVPLATGADPTVDGAAYTNALALLEPEAFNVLAVDSEDAAIHTSVKTHVINARAGGKRIMAVVGEPTTVALGTRRTNMKAMNHRGIVYVTNGFKVQEGFVTGTTTPNIVSLQGANAVGRAAGLIAGSGITESLTHRILEDATDLVGALANADIELVILDGGFLFTKNALGQVQIEYGITTLTTLGADEDAGWKKIRRVKTRDSFVDEVVAVIDPLVGQINNDRLGRASIIAKIKGVINRYIRLGALQDVTNGNTVDEDPARPAVGDQAWFKIGLTDNDSGEKFYLDIGTRFAPAA